MDQDNLDQDDTQIFDDLKPRMSRVKKALLSIGGLLIVVLGIAAATNLSACTQEASRSNDVPAGAPAPVTGPLSELAKCGIPATNCESVDVNMNAFVAADEAAKAPGQHDLDCNAKGAYKRNADNTWNLCGCKCNTTQ